MYLPTEFVKQINTKRKLSKNLHTVTNIFNWFSSYAFNKIAEEIAKNNDKYFIEDFDGKKHVVEKIALNSAFYDDSMTNSHHCPVNGMKNFMRDPDKPLGYPGISGRLTLIGQCKSCPGFVSDWFQPFGVNITTGGGGMSGGSYGFIIYLDDWPALKKNYEELMMFNDEAMIYHKLKYGTLNDYMIDYSKLF